MIDEMCEFQNVSNLVLCKPDVHRQKIPKEN